MGATLSFIEPAAVAQEEDALPQPILPGDASESIATNSLRVLSAEGGSVDFVRNLQRSTGVLTPNGDGVNDQLTLRYALFRLTGTVPVRLEVYTLDGHRIALIEGGLQDAVTRQLVWDGHNENGRSLPAGLYLFSIALDTQAAQKRTLYSLGIAY